MISPVGKGIMDIRNAVDDICFKDEIILLLIAF